VLPRCVPHGCDAHVQALPAVLILREQQPAESLAELSVLEL
jgi:hypothetical protein